MNDELSSSFVKNKDQDDRDVGWKELSEEGTGVNETWWNIYGNMKKWRYTERCNSEERVLRAAVSHVVARVPKQCESVRESKRDG